MAFFEIHPSRFKGHFLNELRVPFKVSYSCMPNMKNIINTHNKKIIKPPKYNIIRTCNCIRKQQCPLNEKCLTNNVLCKDMLRYPKLRYANHKKYSITLNTKLIQNYQTSIGILYQETPNMS